jgi:hypothetical protein
MSNNSDNLMIEILKQIQVGISALKDGQKTTNERLSAIEHHMAGFHLSTSHHNDDIEILK